MTVAATIPLTAFAVTPWADRALSEEARVLGKLISAASEFSGSVTVGEPKRAAQEMLDAAYTAAQVEDRDRAASTAVEASTYAYACQFIRLLPSALPLSDITVDTDGEILFEWDRGRRWIFSVSVGRDGTLTFAGLFGHTKIHGTEHIGDSLPVVISDCLERLSTSPRP
jgi:hypothetical protein